MQVEAPPVSDPTQSCPPSIAECFLQHALRAPQAIALRESAGSRTYGELEATALAIAGQLRQAGCQPGDVVALDGRRGGEFVASLLGVLLARCVVLPLDPGQPAAWCAVALQQAEPRCVLRCAGARLSAGPHAVLQIEPAFAQPLDRADIFPAGLDDPAYLFFTSGTTGQPKGVLGTHGGLAHFIAWQRETFAVAPGDRVAHVTGLSFDVVLREIFVALSAGATLCIPDRTTLEDPARLMNWFADEDISLLHAVPTLAGVWLAEADAGLRLPRLRVSFFAGEPLTRQTVVRWRERIAPGADIINLYGPTETTLAKCWYRVPQRLPFDQMPVGQPLPECEVQVVDAGGSPVPPGEPGEVVIRTRWRTRGYLSAPSPFRADQTGKEAAYFTGDRGRILRDGNLVLLGRIDDQVKIRGVRVEPAGVAAVLAGHPDVAACAVLARAAEPHPRLIAYVVGTAERSALRQYLGERLADAQVPTEFHFVPELPTTANGKLDRSRLADLLTSSAVPGAPSGQRPDTASERRIAAIYAELLGLPLDRPLSVDEDFFDLGGDSLQALAVISRINQAIDEHGSGGRLDVSDLFEAPDIRGLAERLDALRGEMATGPTAVLWQADRASELPLSPAQQRILFQCRLEGEESTSYNVPVAIDLCGELDGAVLETALNVIEARHESLRTRFPNRGDSVCQSIHAPEAQALSCVDLTALDADRQHTELRQRARQQAGRPFRLDHEGPLRRELVKLAADRHVLLLTVHHMAFDGWSRWLLLRELGEHYAALSQGLPTAPAPAIQYADYAVWCRQRQPRAESLAYWQQTLGGAPALQLPTDFTRTGEVSSHGGQITRELSAALLTDLEALATRERATLYMVLLTAFKLVLSRWTAAADLTVGSPVANRPRPELERLIGCFIEMLPIRSDLSDVRSGVEALQRVRSAVIGAFSHADAGFEKIVEHVAPPRRAGHHPFFDVMFNFVNVPQHLADPAGLQLRFAECTEPEARFDLSVYAHRKDGGLQLRLVYKSALFSAGTMAQLLDALVATLGRLAAQPEQPPERLCAGIAAPAVATVVPVPAEPPEVLDRIAPRDDIERRVVAVFGELLGLEQVSVHDNFFALGGHSLLAMQALSRLRRQFDAALPLRLMFSCQTPAELAREIGQLLAEQAPAGIAHETAANPLTLSQQRLLRFMRDNPCSVHYNVPRKLRLRGQVDAERLERAINDVVQRHDVLSTGYRTAEGVPVAGAAGHIALQRIDLAAEADPEAAAAKWVADEVARPFDLDRGPLLRTLLLRLAPQEHVLLVSVHHVTADCWSMGMPFGAADGSAGAWMAGVFFRELWSAYHGAVGQPGDVRRFGDAARQQNAWLAGPEAARQLAYWQTLLADRPPALEVPPDLPRPPVWDFRGERLPFDLDPDTTMALRAFARSRNTTPFVVLQAAFAVLLYERTGQEDLVTGTTAANRSLWEADETVGFFSNNLLLRTELSGDPDFDEVVRRSHAQAFSAFAHQELPFERILEALGLVSEPDRHPLFQIRFLLHLPSDQPFQSDVLTMTPEATGREVAKYDLTLLLADTGTGFTGWLEYATSLYHRDTATTLLQRYRHLLPALLAAPDHRLSDLTGTS